MHFSYLLLGLAELIDASLQHDSEMSDLIAVRERINFPSPPRYEIEL